MRGEKNKLTIGLIALSAILIVVVLYLLVVSPAINGYAVKAQNEGIQYAVFTIMKQASTCQPVPLTFQNQNMSLVWIDCLKSKS